MSRRRHRRGTSPAAVLPGLAWWLAVVAAAVPPMVAYGYLATRGMALSHDSVNYLAGARSLLQGQGYLAMDGYHDSLHPPGLSVLLAGIRLVTGRSLVACALALNGLALLVIIVTSAFLVRTGQLAGPDAGTRSRERPGTVLPSACGALFVGMCPVVLLPATVVWTEAPFLALTLPAWALLLVPGQRHRSRAAWGIGGLLGAACLVRYAGVISVGLAVAVLAWQRRWRDAVVVGALGGVPVLVWIWVNSRFGSPTGERPSSAAGPVEVLQRAGTTLAQWFAPEASGWSMILAGVVVAAAWLVLIVLGARALRGPYGVVLAFAVATTAAVLVIRMGTALDGPDNRLLIVAAPLLVVVGVGLATTALRGPHRWWAAVATAAVLAGALTGWATMNRGAAPPRHNQVVEMACEAPPGAVLVTNRQYEMAYACRRPVLPMPRVRAYASHDRVDDYPELRARTAGKCTWYVWIGKDKQGYLQPWSAVVKEMELSPHRFGSGQRAVVGC